MLKNSVIHNFNKSIIKGKIKVSKLGEVHQVNHPVYSVGIIKQL